MDISTDLDRQNKTGENNSGTGTNNPTRVLTASSIIGDKVENNQGESVGKIKDIMLNLQDGKIQYLIIEFGGFLGIGEKLFAIPFSALKLNADKEDFVLDVEKSFLEKAPGFDQAHWPDTHSHFHAVSTYWGDFMGPNTGIEY
jgi:sporulation protein YlmC with PRC-barrel domain